MGRVPFLPQELARAQKHARTHFPAHHIGPLVDHQRQIAPALNPTAHGGTDYRFRCRAHDQRLFQLGFRIGNQLPLAVTDKPVMRNNRHFLGKAVHMVGLFFKEGQGNKQREIAVIDACSLDFGIHQFLDAFPNAVTPRTDDHASPDTRFLGEIAFGNNLLVPARKILGPGDI